MTSLLLFTMKPQSIICSTLIGMLTWMAQQILYPYQFLMPRDACGLQFMTVACKLY